MGACFFGNFRRGAAFVETVFGADSRGCDFGKYDPVSTVYHPPQSTLPFASAPIPGLGHGLSNSTNAGHLDLKNPTPSSVRRNRAGVQPDAYPFETLRKKRHPLPNGPMDLTMGRMGDFPSATKDLEIVRFQEYVVFAMRGFGVSLLLWAQDSMGRSWRQP